MKLLAFSILSVLVLFFTLVHASAIDDQIELALRKYCSNVYITAPKSNHTYFEDQRIRVTIASNSTTTNVTIDSIDLYYVPNRGRTQYLGNVWKGPYRLNVTSTLLVDLSKGNLPIPGIFEFRSLVHNENGPDCTLVSEPFTLKKRTASEIETPPKLKCTGFEMRVVPISDSAHRYAILVKHDYYATTNIIIKLDLYSIDVYTRSRQKVRNVWTGRQSIEEKILIMRDTIEVPTNYSPSTLFYYKLTTTLPASSSTCIFNSRPFSIIQ